MTTLHDHLRKYPYARPSTVAYLIERDKITQELRRGLEKPSLLKKLLGWIWRV